MNRTGIVGTIGPKTNNRESLLALKAAGMTVARLNGSHNELRWHQKTIRLIHEVLPGMPILLDIPGRKIRTIQLAHEPSFKTGDIITLTTDPDHDGTRKVPVNHANLHMDLHEGAVVYADDGTLRFTVIGLDGKDILCRADSDGKLRSRKGINVPYVKLGGELLTPRDRMMVGFAAENEVDYVGISFVETGHHVDLIRDLTRNGSPRIVAKVENQGGIENMADIISTADAIMIDRGDLSVETDMVQVALMQKKIIAMADRFSKPVIVATEMLHTMIDNPMPTKAEVSDITNAVLDGATAVMLSGETAIGRYPVEAVETMSRIVAAAERHVSAQRVIRTDAPPSKATGIGEAVQSLIRTLPVNKVVAVSQTGYCARIVANKAVEIPIIAVSTDRLCARSMNILPGVTGIHLEMSYDDTRPEHVMTFIQMLWEKGILEETDNILVVAANYKQSGKQLNMLQSHKVADLISSLGWESAATAGSHRLPKSAGLSENQMFLGG